MNNPNDPTEKTDAKENDAAAVESEDTVESEHGSQQQDAEVNETDTSTEVEETVEAQSRDESNDHLYADDAQGQGNSFAATALKLLVLVLVIFGLALWLVPMMAHKLPAGVAKHLMPGQQILDERLAAIEAQSLEAAQSATGGVAELKDEMAALQARLEAAEAATAQAQAEAVAAREAAMASSGTVAAAGVAEETVASAQAAAREAAETAATATAAATEAGKVASAATRDTASLARQMTSFEARLAGLKSEIGAIGDNLAEAAQGDGASSGEITAAFAALKAKVDTLATQEPDLSAFIRRDESDGFATHDDLRSARTALRADMNDALAALPSGGVLATSDNIAELRGSVDGQVSALKDTVVEIGEKADAATSTAQEAKASATEAVNSVAGAIQNASLKASTAALASRLANGVAFSDALDEIVQLTGAPAPDGLSAVAASGVATSAALTRQFKPLAPKAIAADLKAKSGDDPLGQASARLQSVFGGRPKTEQAGDDTGAVLSRVEARLADGDMSAALSEAEALSDAAKSGLGGWLDALRARVAADAAAEAFLAEIGASQG